MKYFREWITGDHAAKAATSGVLEGDVAGLVAKDAFDVIAVVEELWGQCGEGEVVPPRVVLQWLGAI